MGLLFVPIHQKPWNNGLGKCLSSCFADLDLQVRTRKGKLRTVHGFRIDTGANVTSMPMATADAENCRDPVRRQDEMIAYPTDPASSFTISTANGNVAGQLGFIEITFPTLSQWQFRVECLFLPNSKRPLLSLKDLARIFSFDVHWDACRKQDGFWMRFRKDHPGDDRTE